MLLKNERDHIRNAYEIAEDMRKLTKANLQKGDCLVIEDEEGARCARYDEQHRALVLFADVVDYIRDCDVITDASRKKLVAAFYDVLDD